MSGDKYKCLKATDKAGNIMYFETRQEAMEKLGVNKMDISSCIRGRRKVAKGYLFEEVDYEEFERRDNSES